MGLDENDNQNDTITINYSIRTCESKYEYGPNCGSFKLIQYHEDVEVDNTTQYYWLPTWVDSMDYVQNLQILFKKNYTNTALYYQLSGPAM